MNSLPGIRLSGLTCHRVAPVAGGGRTPKNASAAFTAAKNDTIGACPLLYHLQDFPCYPGAGFGIGQCMVVILQLIAASGGNRLQLMVC